MNGRKIDIRLGQTLCFTNENDLGAGRNQRAIFCGFTTPWDEQFCINAKIFRIRFPREVDVLKYESLPVELIVLDMIFDQIERFEFTLRSKETIQLCYRYLFCQEDNQRADDVWKARKVWSSVGG